MVGAICEDWDVDESVEDVHLMVQFGRQRRKITIRVSCDAGMDQRTLMFALNRAYDLVEVQTGHVVEKVTVRTIEKHRHFHGVSLDSVVKCMTIRAFEDRSIDGSGVRVERKALEGSRSRRASRDAAEGSTCLRDCTLRL